MHEIIIRNIKLSKLTSLKLKEPYFSIYEDMKRILSNLIIYKTKHNYYNKYIYFGNSEDELIFRYDTISKYVYFDYVSAYEQFNNDILKYNKYELLSWYVSEHYNLELNEINDIIAITGMLNSNHLRMQLLDT